MRKIPEGGCWTARSGKPLPFEGFFRNRLDFWNPSTLIFNPTKFWMRVLNTMGNLLLFWLLPSTESIFSSKINAHIKVLPFLRGARNTSLVENPIYLTIELSKSRRIGLNTTCGYLKNCLLATKNIKSNATASSRWCGLGFMMCIRWLVIVSYVRTNNFGTEKCVSDVVTTISKYLRTAEALQLAILSNTPPHRRFSLTGFICQLV